MFFVIFTAIGLFALGAFFGKRRAYWRMYAREHGYGYGRGHSHGCHGGGCGHRRWGRHGHHGYGHDHGHGHGPFWMRSMFEMLEATPGQQREIHEAFGAFREEMRGLKDLAFGARGDLASALRDEHLDEEALGSTLAGGDEAIERMRKAVAGLVARLHTVLDAEQRARLASFIERRGFGRGFGPGGFGPSPGWA